MEALRKAARKTRNPVRNELILLMMYRHGLRVSELCKIQMEQLDLDQSNIFVKRIKNGISGMHPIAGDELRLLRRYLRERKTSLPWLFVSERGNQLARSSVNKMCGLCSDIASLPPVNPHMLRHGCGFFMINKGHDIRAIQVYLFFKDTATTEIYTKLNEKQFVGMWE